jgi:hypothetical protein
MLPKGKTDIQNKLSEAFLFRDRNFSDMEVVTIPVAHVICISFGVLAHQPVLSELFMPEFLSEGNPQRWSWMTM